ncbi:hypothetical protein [Streptomyces sp. 7N604]|uniref:hypothetical protein n=1 Tax=Streptomyces sp. 7N604 TaxID=3457415 RepID=UPI003FD601EF
MLFRKDAQHGTFLRTAKTALPGPISAPRSWGRWAARPAPTAAAPAPSGGPTTLPRPNGFQPEGIAIGAAPYAYFGSLADGSIYRASLATGQGEVISQGTGNMSVGLKIDDRGRLFIGGGYSREIRVVGSRSGEILATYPVGTDTTMVNDVILTPRAAWFTDSFNAQLVRAAAGAGR